MKTEYDVIVIGGGPGGICAAAAAASNGASTLLVERYGFLGGMATAGLVNPFMAYTCGGLNLASPCFSEILERLKKQKALCNEGLIFDDETLKFVLDQMMNDYGVDVLLHSVLSHAETEGNQITKVNVLTKGGMRSLKASVFVDSTGDGDLAAVSGAQFEMGRDKDGACQPMTLCFRIAGVTGDLHADALARELTPLFQAAKKRNEIQQPREDVLIFNTLSAGTYHFNTTRVIDRKGTCSLDLTKAEIEGRRQAFELLQLFKKSSPRFRNASIVKLASQIGIRETRRVMGLYRLTEEDILGARKFPDGITRSCYPVDIHNPDGAGTVLKHLPEGEYYEVPFRSLVSADISNLLIGSRCICSSHEAHSSLRVMPVVAGIGEAAGTAAALASQNFEDVSAIDGKQVRKMILDAADFKTIV